VYSIFALPAIAPLALVYALVSHDFSVGYVAQVGSRATPLAPKAIVVRFFLKNAWPLPTPLKLMM
jgi:cytochrome c biogenesis factor